MRSATPAMILIPLLFMFSLHMKGQEVLINELAPSNTTYPDNFANTSDWIELYNAGESVLELEGFRLSDQPDFESAWTFGDVTLDPGGHLLVFASGRDIRDVLTYNTIVNEGDGWRYFIPEQNLTSEWRMPGFDDASWATGNSGFGYGDGDDNTIVPQGTRSVFIRKSFTLDDTAGIAAILLHMDYDDAFVAYLNGVEVARANIGAAGQNTPFNAEPQNDHEAVMYEGGHPDRFDASFVIPYLEQGENVLAIQIHNISTTSSDLTGIPFLTLGLTAGSSGTVPPVLQIPTDRMHTDFKLSMEGETVYLFSADGTVLDTVAFPWVPAGISYGRLEDGSPDWVLFQQPTPDSVNTGPHYYGINQDTIAFSHPSGLYDLPFALELSGGEDIRYTLDSSEPNESSAQYTGPIAIEENTIVKAAIFVPGLLGQAMIRSYIIGASHPLPVISLNTEPENLWDPETGMYVLGNDYQADWPHFGANFWEDWEYPFHFSYFNTDGELEYESNAGVKIFGAWSRAFEQKSFALYARAELGSGKFQFPFFEERPYKSYESLVLRNSGNDWEYSMLRDVVMTSLMAGSHVDYQAYRPVVTYLNGEYWGIYNMREKINEHFIASLHNVKAEEVDLLELDGEVKHGDNDEYIELREFIESNSLADNANYEYVTDRIDEINFIQYQVAEIYYNNGDWPGNNIDYWKAGDGKWRWIMFDTDFGLGIFDPNAYKYNSLAFATDPYGPSWPNPPWSTLFLRKLIENEQFRIKFVNYFADAMNSVFLPGPAVAHVTLMAAGIEGEIFRHRQRWGQSVGSWEYSVNRMKDFFTGRPGVARNFIMDEFDLPAVHQITIHNDQDTWGSVRVNSLVIESPDWSGKYFQDNPISLTAFAKPGYKFDHWSGDVDSDEPMVFINLTQAASVTAHFVGAGPINQPVVINEINYNSPDYPDPSDWVELCNFSEEAVDVSGWIFSDGDSTHSYVVPAGTVMDAGGFLVLCRDKADFTQVYPDVENVHGGFEFGLSSAGDAVCLYDPAGALLDSVYYQPAAPWPEAANGMGPTLELISPDLDNLIPDSWHAFQGYGTPGALNHYISGVPSPPSGDRLKVFPNPARNAINIEWDAPEFNLSSIRLYDLTGRLNKSMIVPQGTRLVRMDVSSLHAGPYLVQVTLSDGSVIHVRMQKF